VDEMEADLEPGLVEGLAEDDLAALERLLSRHAEFDAYCLAAGLEVGP
jgi:hypothetical protein